jgi:ATP synthase protein I
VGCRTSNNNALPRGGERWRVVKVYARNSFGDARKQVSKFRGGQNGQGKERRKDQGYLRVDENLLKNDTFTSTRKKETKPVEERRFKDNLARESSDYIWNTNWKKELDNWEKSTSAKDERIQQQSSPAQSSSSSSSSSSPTATASGGGISFSRVSELNDLSLDLSEQLRRTEEDDEATAEKPLRTRGGRKEFLNFPAQSSTSSSSPSSSFASAIDPSLFPEDPTKTEEARRQYAETKSELFVYTALTGLAVGFLCKNYYGEDIAWSYGVGCAASLFYLRLLSRTVDSLASEDAAAQIGGAGGQARLLVPAILVLGYSKANPWVIENYGVHLNIVAILAGFFTYKAGTFGQVLKSTMQLMAEERKRRE